MLNNKKINHLKYPFRRNFISAGMKINSDTIYRFFPNKDFVRSLILHKKMDSKTQPQK